MDKTAIKKYAIESREKLIDEIKLKSEILGITADGIREKLDISTSEVEYYIDDSHPIIGSDISKRQQLVKELNRRAKKNDFQTAFKDLVEEVAYTWFNRIIAIRFMEVNDYLPSRTNVLSSTQNRNEPDIMIDPLSIESDLGGFNDAEKNLIEKASDTLNPNDMDDLYHMLFIKQANALNKNLPYLFEKTNNYAELLFTPNYHNGVIKHLIDDVNVDDFDVSKGGQVEIIGWLYQYYNTEPKDIAFKKKKYTESDIPAVTQLFTPDWIVKYMVDNSLGRYWIDILHAKGDQRESKEIAKSYGWHYFMPEAEQTNEVRIQINSNNDNLKNIQLEDITFLDPAMGSGHILIYAFDVFMKLYEMEGYSKRDAAKLIIQKNLFGLDIDTRAFQLSYFALMMKARQYNRRFLTQSLKPNVFDIPESTDLVVNDFDSVITDENIKNYLKLVLDAFKYGNEYGSLIHFGEKLDWDSLNDIVKENTEQKQLTLESIDLTGKQRELKNIISTAKILNMKFSISVTNPPYMGSGKMDAILGKYIKKRFPNSKSDLFATFMERLGGLTQKNGYYAMVTQHAWMFLSSFESLRSILKQKTLINMAHLGTRAFEEIGGEVVQSTAFVYKNQGVPNYIGTYERLVDFNSQQKKQDAYLKAVRDNSVNYLYRTNQANFSKIPGMPIAYWASENLLNDFINGIKMDSIVSPKVGLQTGDNNKFIRQWFEVNNSKVSYYSKSISDSLLSGKKWFPYNKGGSYRKWYGNYDYVVNWEKDGKDIKNFSWPNGKQRSVVRNPDYYFREAITWPKITSGKFNARYREIGSIHDTAGNEAFSDDTNMILYSLGLLGTKVTQLVMDSLNPTINSQVGDFGNIPVIVNNKNQIITLVRKAIKISKLDWNNQEIAWDFSKNNLPLNNESTIKSSVIAENKRITEAREELASIETELNKKFIHLYKLDNELDYHVDPDEVTLADVDVTRDIKGLLSYFVGLVFGRYSLDKDGLIYSGDSWNDSNYVSFKPNRDNVILLNDDKYFDDDRDIINRLKKFLSVAFDENLVKENMEYIASIVGKKADTSEGSIRRYFVEEFFKDHKQMYKKRPIYWELSSGKNDGFKALMYLHRYDENEFAMVRTDYIHPLQGVYESRLNQLQKLIDVEESAKVKKQLDKSIKHLGKQLDEIKKYDIVIQHVANQKISLDLDDGVLANFDKIQSIEGIFSKIK